jgi:hypothetical protein
MMKAKYYASSLIILTMLWSCTNISDSNSSEGTTYFPIKEFIEIQISKLEGKSIAKEIIINGKKERSETTPTMDEWVKEFDLFIQSDINRPLLSGAYDTERSEKYLIHSLKEGEKGKVKKIVVQYVGEHISQISFISKTENPFYSSQVRGVLMFHGLTGEIDQYSLENIQEVVFSKPNKMIVSASIK